MGDKLPLVSIIMPVYNASQFIAEAIDSVLTQTHSNWELLIINDGSTDSSEQVILSYNDERIQYHLQENKGVSAARNIGLKSMKGDFFCFLDADDILPKNSIASRLQVFDKDKKIDFVDGWVEVFETKTGKIKRTYTPDFEGNPFDELISLSGKCFFGITWMFRNNHMDYQFNDSLTHGEDLLFFIEYSQNGIYRSVDSLIYKCRTGIDSAMSDLKKLEKGYFILYDILKSRYGISTAFKSKIRSIVFKSYLGRFQLVNAIKVLLR